MNPVRCLLSHGVNLFAKVSGLLLKPPFERQRATHYQSMFYDWFENRKKYHAKAVSNEAERSKPFGKRTV